MKNALLRFLLNMHSFLYKLISKLAVSCNSGVHPKHALTAYSDFFLNNIDKDSAVLDIGCGMGMVEKAIAQKCKRITAVDIDETSVRKAKKNNSYQNVDYIHADATCYDFGKRFDAVVLSNVLEHIENRAEFLRKIGEISGKILVRVPMLDRDWLTPYKKQLGLEYRLDKTHFVEYTVESFVKESESAGFEILKYQVRFGELYAVIIKKPK